MAPMAEHSQSDPMPSSAREQTRQQLLECQQEQARIAKATFMLSSESSAAENHSHWLLLLIALPATQIGAAIYSASPSLGVLMLMGAYLAILTKFAKYVSRNSKRNAVIRRRHHRQYRAKLDRLNHLKSEELNLLELCGEAGRFHQPEASAAGSDAWSTSAPEAAPDPSAWSDAHPANVRASRPYNQGSPTDPALLHSLLDGLSSKLDAPTEGANDPSPEHRQRRQGSRRLSSEVQIKRELIKALLNAASAEATLPTLCDQLWADPIRIEAAIASLCREGFLQRKQAPNGRITYSLDYLIS